MTSTLPDTLDPATKGTALARVAEGLAVRLHSGSSLSRADLVAAMRERFGATDASGLWSMRDAYDAAEAAQALLAREVADIDDAALARAVAIAGRVPTQTYRSEDQIGFQQFSTPLAVALVAAAAAAVRQGDTVLEPSAGTGLLAAACAKLIDPAALHLNELDPRRAAILRLLFPGSPVTVHDAARLADRLPGLRPDVVLMNPPFSRSAGEHEDRHAGARHLLAALAMLREDGRLVAIMPEWFAADASGRDGRAAVARVATSMLDMLLPANAYQRHGTSVRVRILVFDKGRTVTQTATPASIEAALAVVRALPGRQDRTETGTASRQILGKAGPATGRKTGLIGRTRPVTRPTPTLNVGQDGTVARIDYTALDVPIAAEAPVGIYVPYRVARLRLIRHDDHPTALVESMAMASIAAPKPTYMPQLPASARNALSAPQLETLIYAGDAFTRDLGGVHVPTKDALALEENEAGEVYRLGYFLGDGTGAGKGRQVAAVLLDRWCRGERRHLWISKSTTLIEDARRDWTALGGLGIDIQPLDVWPLGTPVTMPVGILFATYATLRSARADKGSRLDQIIDWLGADGPFEGLIVFDESHAMAHAAGTESGRGIARGSEQGLCGLRLQNRLPRARVLYVSATGATDVANLAYATRLGLWGTGTAFASREQFMSELQAGGVAAMELVARDLKAQGLYASRALSFAGVEYDTLVHTLSAEQIALYDTYAGAWEIVHQNLDAVLRATAVIDPIDGATLNGQALGAALSRFESTKQRFFAQLLLAMKLPSLLPAIASALDDGAAVVVQLVSTAEAMLDRRLDDLDDDARANLDIDLSPREYLVDYLTNAFPVMAMETYRDDQRFLRSRPMVDDAGDPVRSAEAIAARDALIERLCALPAVATALDAIIERFGVDMVAEVTGRTRRLVRLADGSQRLENRSARANLGETAAFMADTKRILIFSDAGGTGRSYHADLAAPNTRRRVHFLLEPGWRADAAVQGLGRTHRTHQASAPLFRPVTTNVKAERRFTSTIARRLDSLGALTRGQRQTGGQNLFDPADNLESAHAKEALSRWFRLLAGGRLTSTTMAAFQARSGLKLLDEHGVLRAELPPIQRWLNRLLAFPIALQDAIFEEFTGLIEARIDALREAGRLDVGVETIAAERVVVQSDRLLRTDPRGAETRLLRIELHRRRRMLAHDRLLAMHAKRHGFARMLNERSGRAAVLIAAGINLADDGRVSTMHRLIRPDGERRLSAETLAESHWRAADAAEFETRWRAEVADGQSRLDVETINLATGLLLPIWNTLPKDEVTVWRVLADDGQAWLGRLVPDAALCKLGEALGVTTVDMLDSAAVVRAAAASRTPVPLPGQDGLTLAGVMVNGSRRLEVKGFEPARLTWYKSLGAFTEIIAFKTRLFLPPDRGEAILDRMTGQDRPALIAA